MLTRIASVILESIGIALAAAALGFFVISFREPELGRWSFVAVMGGWAAGYVAERLPRST